MIVGHLGHRLEVKRRVEDRVRGLLEPAIQSRAGKMIGLVRIADGVLL